MAASTTQAHSGTYSAKVTFDPPGSGIATRYQDWGAAKSRLITRFWVYWEAALIASMTDDNDVVTLLDYTNGIVVEYLLRCEILRTGSANYLTVALNGLTNYDIIVALPSAAAWHCIEIDFTRHATAGSCYLWIDGALVDSTTGIDTGDTDVNYIWLGSLASVGAVGNYYIDDVVIDDSKYIGTGWRVTQDGAVGSPFGN